MPEPAQAVSCGIRAMASWVSGRPFLSTASIYPTHRCNLRCLYCSSPYMKTPELTTGQWCAIVRELAGLGCRRVTILGGEPLLRRDVGDIIQAVKDHGMRCVLTSNGLLVARRLEALKPLDTLVLSLDAPTTGCAARASPRP